MRERACIGNMGAFVLDFLEGSVVSRESREAATRGARRNAGMESAFAWNAWKHCPKQDPDGEAWATR